MIASRTGYKLGYWCDVVFAAVMVALFF